MLGWRTVGVAAAEKLLRLRLPAKPTEHEWKGMLKGKLTKKAKEEKPADWFDTPTWSLWSTIPRSKIPTFATVAVSYAGRRKASVARSKKAYEKVWMRVIQKVFGSDCGTAGGGSGAVGDEPVGALKEKVATLPILDVSLPLMDNATGTVRGGTKSDFLDAVWVPKPPDRPPTAQGDAAAGFSAIVVDFSAAMVKVCATLKGRKDRITFGDVVDSALAFALDRARRANASTAYLAIDPYPPEGDDDAAEEKLSVKRWVHLCRAENRIRARKYGSIDADTVIEGGAGKVMDVLTWSSNKRKVMELAYTRLAELCLKSEFLHDGEAVAWVGDKPNNYFHCATATGGVTASTVPELQSTSPEADFKFAAAIEHWLSAGGTTDSRPIAVWVEDTDVVTHVLTHFWRRCIGKDIEADAIPGIAFMRERKSRSTYQHVGDIVKGLEERLGYDAAHTVLDVLHQAHVISGCDYTSFVAAKKKKTFWNVLTAMARHSRLRSVLITGLGKLSAEDATVGVGLERHVATDVMDAVETFWACLHLPTAALEKVGKSAEDVPLPQLHTARTVADPNFLDGEAFPLSRVELEEHALRSAYVLTQFRVGTNTPRTALTHSSAVGWGFHIDEDGYLQVRWVRGKTLASLVGADKRRRGGGATVTAATTADVAAGPAQEDEADESLTDDVAAGPAQEDETDESLTDDDEEDDFWGDDAAPPTLVTTGGLPAGAVPACSLPIERGAILAINEGGKWAVGEVVNATETTLDVKMKVTDSTTVGDEDAAAADNAGTTTSSFPRRDLGHKAYGRTWVELLNEL